MEWDIWLDLSGRGTFGVGRHDQVGRVMITWPNGAIQEFKNIATGRTYECTEGKGLRPWDQTSR
jgi:hypothetical protein